jgi:hypothetical protein
MNQLFAKASDIEKALEEYESVLTDDSFLDVKVDKINKV